MICEYLYIYARNCDYVYNFMHTYHFENALYLFEIGLHVFEIGFKLFEIGLHLFEIEFYLFEICLYLFEFGPKKCRTGGTSSENIRIIFATKAFHNG